MARHYERDFDRVFDFARSALHIQTLSPPMTAALDDEGLSIDPDEPPDYRFTSSPQSFQSAILVAPVAQAVSAGVYSKKAATPMNRQSSLLTEGLLTAANLKDIPLSRSALMSRVGSRASAYSLTSNHGLTSDGGMSSAGHSTTPSPPLPPTMQKEVANVVAPKVRSIKFAGERPSQATTVQLEAAKPEVENKPRKTCISFACAPPRPAATQQLTGDGQQPQKKPTIKFACDAKPIAAASTAPKPAALPAPDHNADMQTTPRPTTLLNLSSRSHGGFPSTVIESTPAVAPVKVTLADAVAPTQVRKLEKKKLRQLTGTRPEDEDWMTDDRKARKPITVSDTLRKENAIRKLAEEASQEIDEEYDIDDIVDDEDEDDDLPATGSRYMAFDDDESDGGHETDDEEGFAASDDESDDDPDFQFWTTAQNNVQTATESTDLLRPRHHRSGSDSSLESHVRHDASRSAPKPFLSGHSTRRRRSPKETKMRPGTPELPDSTDFVCGTLDEDRPLEDAYLSCVRQRKLEKRGVIPQDLDPSFPTSDHENIDDEEEDEVTEGLASTASDHHFLGGRFDESDVSQNRGRNDRARMPTPQRLRSPPPPKPRLKSPAPTMLQSRARSPAPRKLFGRSPLRAKSPAPIQILKSPPTSPRRISFRTPHLAQRNTPVRTASLPHTPNPFFVAHERKLRANAKKHLDDLEGHNRGPIDIKQGLEERKQRRKEHYWRRHCRDHKDKSRRCAPGKGAERMRELGLEMANRNRAYGQKLELMLSV